MAYPTASFQRCDGRNDPCAQSCMKMNVRITKPVASGMSSTVSHGAGPNAKHIAVYVAPSSTSVTVSCATESATLPP